MAGKTSQARSAETKAGAETKIMRILRYLAERPDYGASQGRIVSYLDISQRTVDSALHRLEGLGLAEHNDTGVYRFVPPRLEHAGDRDPLELLAPREQDVLALAALGLGNGEIGAELGIAPQTVSTYMKSIIHKLFLDAVGSGARIKAAAVLYASPTYASKARR